MKVSGIVFLVFWSLQVNGQVVNILVDSVANARGQYPTEPGIAISFKDPNKLVLGASSGKVYVTEDGGKEWKNVNLTSPFGIGYGARVLSDFSGNFYYIHLADPDVKASETFHDRIVVQRSKDNGHTWDGGNEAGYNPPNYQVQPNAIADRKGNIYLTWTEIEKPGSKEAECVSRILFSKSSNGSKWSKPSIISVQGGNCIDGDGMAKGGVPAIASDGKMFVAWSQNGILYLDRSFDGGDFWLSNDIAITEQRGGWQFDVPGVQSVNGLPTLICNNTKGNFAGALYLVWAEQVADDDTDIYFTRSLNYGDNWTQPARINDDDPGKHQFMPAMTIDQVTGHVYILYYDRRDHDDNKTDVYMAWSDDHGATFKNVKVSQTPFLPQDESLGTHISIAAHNGIITPVWTRSDNGKSSIWMAIIRHSELAGAQPEPVSDKKKKKKSD